MNPRDESELVEFWDGYAEWAERLQAASELPESDLVECRDETECPF